jgi:hypothetical protein
LRSRESQWQEREEDEQLQGTVQGVCARDSPEHASAENLRAEQKVTLHGISLMWLTCSRPRDSARPTFSRLLFLLILTGFCPAERRTSNAGHRHDNESSAPAYASSCNCKLRQLSHDPCESTSTPSFVATDASRFPLRIVTGVSTTPASAHANPTAS